MRWLLITVVVVFPLMWVGAIWFLLREGLNPPTWAPSLSDIVNIALFVLTVVSIGISLIGLSIATASYQQAVDTAKKQLEAGEEQSRILQSQAEALDAARHALDEQLALAREQRAEYLAKLARHPRIEIQIGAAGHEPGFEMHNKNLTITTQPGRNAYDFVFVLRNTGDATLQKPLLIFVGNPEQVNFEPRQFGGMNIQDFLPFSQVKKGYRFEVRVSFPQGIATFDMLMDVSGENMNADSTRFHVTVVRQSPPAPPQQ
jgi:hypothetical protein